MEANVRMRLNFNSFVFLFTFILLLFVFQCSPDNSKEDDSFGIYLIKDSKLDILAFDSLDIEDIELPDSPVASICDIDTYKIFQSESGLSLSHSIIFKSNMRDICGSENCYFVLVVNGTRMYKGEYWANFMNTALQNVLIYPYQDDEFHIMALEDNSGQINDSRIIKTLIDSGVNVVYQNIDL